MGLVVENPPASAGGVREAGSIPGLGRSPGEGHSNSLQYSCQENHVERGAWWAIIRGVTQSQTRLKWFSMRSLYCIVMVLATHQHESATGIHMSPASWTFLPLSSPAYPSGLSQRTNFGCPASCIELALVIYLTCGNVHISMLFSQIIPPSPSPTESKSLLFTPVSSLLPARMIISTVFLNSIYMRFLIVIIKWWHFAM